MSAKWTQEHDTALVRAVIKNTIASRRNIYGEPGLEDVSANSGNRINSRLLVILRNFGSQFGGNEGAGMVDEEIRRVSGGRGKKGATEEGGGAAERPSGNVKRKREHKVRSGSVDCNVKLEAEKEDAKTAARQPIKRAAKHAIAHGSTSTSDSD